MKEYLIEIDGVFINLAQMLFTNRDHDTDPKTSSYIYFSGGSDKLPMRIRIKRPIEDLNQKIREKVWPPKTNP